MTLFHIPDGLTIVCFVGQTVSNPCPKRHLWRQPWAVGNPAKGPQDWASRFKVGKEPGTKQGHNYMVLTYERRCKKVQGLINAIPPALCTCLQTHRNSLPVAMTLRKSAMQGEEASACTNESRHCSAEHSNMSSVHNHARWGPSALEASSTRGCCAALQLCTPRKYPARNADN